MFLDSSDFREGVMNESSRMVTRRKIKKKRKTRKKEENESKKNRTYRTQGPYNRSGKRLGDLVQV